MEKFIKLKEDVSLHSLVDLVSDDNIIILRESKTTGTIQIKVMQKMSARKIREAFKPYTVEKIFNEFPYPLSEDGFARMNWLRIKRLFA